MEFNYYYGSQADQFSFIRIPKVMLTEELFSGLSIPAKVLYGVLLDRMTLSRKNAWFDEDKVFENLLDVSDRKSKGAFYTPREIVHYMCQATIINYLASKTNIPEEDIRKFIIYGEYFRDEDTKKTLPIENETGRLLQGDEIYYYKHHMEFDRDKDLEIPETIFSYKKNVNRLIELDNLLANVKVVL